MPTDPRLDSYRRKRDFQRSREPAPRPSRPRRGSRRFVVQQHRASSLHHDLRLEAGGVLKSWAVPKGPSTDPRERRLEFWLDGHKLSGGYALTRTGGTDANRLLVNLRDETADARRNPVSTEPRSVRSGRTLDEVTGDAPEPERREEG